MKTNSISRKLMIVFLASVMTIMFSVPQVLLDAAYANSAGKTTGVETGYDVDFMVSLSADDDISVVIPMDGMNQEAIQDAIDANQITLSLDRNKTRKYNDTTLFPNQKDGGALDSWKTQRNTAMFTDVNMEATDDGLKVTFKSNCYFAGRTGRADYSAPHSNGGAYLDICGYFELNAKVDGAVKGKSQAKVVPYEDFHLMSEIYADIDAMAAYDSDYYVKKDLLGKSTGGRDIPYLIVASDKSAVSDWLDYTEAVESAPDAVLADIKAGKYDDLKVPVMYSNIHSNEVAATDSIMNFAWKIIKGEDLTYNDLTGFTADGQKELETQMGEVGQRGSVAIPDLIKDKATYLGYLTDGSGASAVVDLDKYYTQNTVTLSTDELLEDVFFILVPEENVDGRTFITRAGENGYDYNRDNSFQTTPETAAMQKLIGTYNPVSFTEFHGRVNAFQCEPCDPPHEPNFEYDLLGRHLIQGGENFGKVAVANNDRHNSYVIPQRDYLEYTGNKTSDGQDETYWSDPWDDMSTSYTPQFAMLHGACAYTVEFPAYDDAMAQAAAYGMIGQSNYVGSVKTEYLEAQAEIYKRGVHNENSDAYDKVGQWLADQYDVEGAEMDVFRPEFDGEGENGNFYPECYIIPLDAANQKNLQAANDMMVWLARNDVKINLASKRFTYNGVTYPKGTMIISMYQAKRSVANGALYDGTLINGWTILYSEGITQFNETRGFDMETVTKPADYKVIAAAMGDAMDYSDCVAYQKGVGSDFSGVEGADVIIRNTSTDAVKAVNALLKAKKVVAMVTKGSEQGNFITSYDAYESIADDYVLNAKGVDDKTIVAKKIEGGVPSVFIPGLPSTPSSGCIMTNVVGSYQWNYDTKSIKAMGFKITEDVNVADAVVGGTNPSGAALTAILEGKPFMGYTSASRNMTRSLGLSVSRSSVSGAMDCLGSVTYPDVTMVNASYKTAEDDIYYGYGVGWFTNVPNSADILIAMDGSKTPTEGFIPLLSDSSKKAYDTYINGSVQAFSYKGANNKGQNIDVTLFANSVNNKLHQTDEYRYISNFLFSHQLGAYYYSDVELAQSEAEAAEAKADAAEKEARAAEARAQEAEAKAAESEEARLAAEQARAEAEEKARIAEEARAAADAALAEMKAKEEAAKKAAKAKPATVSKLKLKAGKKKVTVTWKKAANAKTYKVYRATKKNGKYKVVKTTSSKKVTVKKLKKGKKYYFKVKAYNGSVAGNFSAIKAVRAK